MTKISNDIIVSKTEEAEEINAPEAKQVEALDFHPRRVGSSPIWSTKEKEDIKKEWVEQMKNRNNNFTIVANDIDWVKLQSSSFNCAIKTDTIGGRDFSRLSVLQR